MNKPIHKFNNSREVTLCRVCRAVISEQLIDREYCDKCKFNYTIFNKKQK